MDNNLFIFNIPIERIKKENIQKPKDFQICLIENKKELIVTIQEKEKKEGKEKIIL